VLLLGRACFPGRRGERLSRAPVPGRHSALSIGSVVFLDATRRSLGPVGVVLAAALCGGVIWLFIEWDVVSAGNVLALQHLALGVVRAILAVGMSWAHLRQRLTEQLSTDEVD
jgi:hypothetical protein